jgi:endonuclease/exonuclease/phosphatase (EEP) superfamily protein YafD
MIKLGQRFNFLLWGIFLLMLQGCAHESAFTQADIRIYSGPGNGEQPAESDSLVCVSYNIAFSEKLDQALVDLSETTVPQRPDILLLQEMDAEGTAYLARHLGMNYFYFPSFIHPHHGRLFGNAVLSPWPLSEARTMTLPHSNPLTDNYRAALAVDVHLKAGVIQVVSVHTSTLIVDLENRVEQIVVVRDSLVSPSGPVIVGGDFNTGTNWEGTLFRRVMRQVGFRETRPPKGRTARGGPLDIFGYHLKLDHLYYRDLEFVSAGVCRNTAASDHFPIWGVFRWQKN